MEIIKLQPNERAINYVFNSLFGVMRSLRSLPDVKRSPFGFLGMMDDFRDEQLHFHVPYHNGLALGLFYGHFAKEALVFGPSAGQREFVVHCMLHRVGLGKLGVEAGKAYVEFVHNEFGVERFGLYIPVANSLACRFASKIGFVFSEEVESEESVNGNHFAKYYILEV